MTLTVNLLSLLFSFQFRNLLTSVMDKTPGCQNESLTDFPDMLIGNYRRVSLLLMFKVVSLYTLTAMFKKTLYVLF